MRYAQKLTEAGVEFEMLVGSRRADALTLANSSIAEAVAGTAQHRSAEEPPELHLFDQDSGVVAVQRGRMLSAAVVSAVQFEDEPGERSGSDDDAGGAADGGTRTSLFLRALGTAPEYRSRGLATVLLGLLPQVLQQAGLPTKAQVIARIPESRATFFHRAGYMVELPHAGVPESVDHVARRLLLDFGEESRWAHQSLA